MYVGYAENQPVLTLPWKARQLAICRLACRNASIDDIVQALMLQVAY